MKNLHILLALVLVACMVFMLCACTQDPADMENNTPPQTESEPTEGQQPSETVSDGKVTYTVNVTDENGNPVAGVVVQLCEGSTCKPAATDTDGKAMYRTAEADYKVSVTQAPEGYQADATEYHFEDGAYELTIVLKAAG